MSGVEIRQFSFKEVVDSLHNRELPYAKGYLAMYSSWFGGITTDPRLMMVPVDDHVVHRGDGVFEAIKCTGGKIYACDRHLQRLWKSAELVHMPLPFSADEIKNIICQTIQAAKGADCLIRLYVTRGPGGFTTNPYECVGSQLYIVITALNHLSEERYNNGVTLKTSAIPIKEGGFARIKSCNYLANVLMKKEAVDAGVDFTVTLDENGNLGEGSTENMMMLTEQRELVIPRFDKTLRGITAIRIMELAACLVEKGDLKKIDQTDVRPEQAYKAQEIFMTSTTMDLLPVVRYDGHQIGTGRPGPIFQKILNLMRKDLKQGDDILTPIF